MGGALLFLPCRREIVTGARSGQSCTQQEEESRSQRPDWSEEAGFGPRSCQSRALPWSVFPFLSHPERRVGGRRAPRNCQQAEVTPLVPRILGGAH